MPEVVAAPVAAPQAPIEVASAPVVAAGPRDRMAAALEMLHKPKAEPAKDAEKPAEGKAEDPAKPAPVIEDPAEKLHVAMSKLNQRESQVRQREQAIRQQSAQSKADATELAELRQLKAMIADNPREAIRKAAGEDKEHEVFDKYVGQVAATPEQRRLEDMQARLDKFERDRTEGEKKSQSQQQNDRVANVVREYKGGIVQQMNATPEKYLNAHVAAQSREVFEIEPASEGQQARYGNVYDVALDVADKFAAKTKQFMPHARALELVEGFLAERETQRTGHRQKFAPKPAEPSPEAEAKKAAAPGKARTVTVRHTLSNAMQGNAAARVPKTGKQMSQSERLQNALQHLRR